MLNPNLQSDFWNSDFENFTLLCTNYKEYHDLWPPCITPHLHLMQKIKSFSNSPVAAGYFYSGEQSIFKKKYLQTRGLSTVHGVEFWRILLKNRKFSFFWFYTQQFFLRVWNSHAESQADIPNISTSLWASKWFLYIRSYGGLMKCPFRALSRKIKRPLYS